MRRLTVIQLLIATLTASWRPGQSRSLLATTTITTESESGDCAFEEIQLASDGTLARRSLAIGDRVTPNTTLNGTVAPDESHFYHLCILRHEHEHVVHVNLTTSYRRFDDSGANLFLSSLDKYPRLGRASWNAQRPGNDVIKLYTYLDGFPRKSDVQNRSLALHIAVVGVGDASTRYNLTVSVLDLPITDDILAREAYYTKLHRATQAQEQQRRRLRGHAVDL